MREAYEAQEARKAQEALETRLQDVTTSNTTETALVDFYFPFWDGMG